MIYQYIILADGKADYVKYKGIQKQKQESKHITITPVSYTHLDVYKRQPEGNPVAMVHCNNGTSELNAWIGIFQEVLQLAGKAVNKNDLYQLLFHKALEADAAAGGLLACNYLSGEHITGFAKGFPLFVRSADSTFDLANFMLTQLYASLATLKIGMDILTQQEHVQLCLLYTSWKHCRAGAKSIVIQ